MENGDTSVDYNMKTLLLRNLFFADLSRKEMTLFPQTPALLSSQCWIHNDPCRINPPKPLYLVVTLPAFSVLVSECTNILESVSHDQVLLSKYSSFPMFCSNDY